MIIQWKWEIIMLRQYSWSKALLLGVGLFSFTWVRNHWEFNESYQCWHFPQKKHTFCTPLQRVPRSQVKNPVWSVCLQQSKKQAYGKHRAIQPGGTALFWAVGLHIQWKRKYRPCLVGKDFRVSYQGWGWESGRGDPWEFLSQTNLSSIQAWQMTNYVTLGESVLVPSG